MNNDKNFKNTEITKAIKDVTLKTTYEDYLPIQIEDKIQLTADVNPNNNRVLDVYSSQSSGVTLYTTPVDPNKVFYLTGVWVNATLFSLAPNGSFGSAQVAWTDMSGNGQSVIILCGENNSNATSITFSHKGIQLPAGTAITLSGGGSGNAPVFAGGIAGYVQDKTLYTQRAGGSS